MRHRISTPTKSYLADSLLTLYPNLIVGQNDDFTADIVDVCFLELSYSIDNQHKLRDRTGKINYAILNLVLKSWPNLCPKSLGPAKRDLLYVA